MLKRHLLQAAACTTLLALAGAAHAQARLARPSRSS